ncbi:MAG: nucleotidyltransferase domain-containing protein [Gemmatimonadetes bacterium]|nr:nucleotidyltransferase domain-containing protein [Gemmatimonadota bacterium]
MSLVAQEIEFDAALLDAVSKRLGLRRVILFGSRATREPPPLPESDIDLAISFTAPACRASWWDCHTELASVFPDAQVDLAFLADANPLFRWEIARDGLLLWGDPLDHLEFRAFAFRDFMDSGDLRALERSLFEKKLAWIRRRLHAAA